MSAPTQVRAAEERSNTLIAAMQAKPGNTPDTEATPPPEAPKPAPQAVPEPTAEEWRARYQTLQGKYNAELPRTQRELREVKEQAASLNEQITSLKAELQAAKTAKPAEGSDDLDRFDPELVAMVQRTAAAAVEPIRTAQAESQAEREARKRAEQQAAKEVEFSDAMDDLVPDWRTIDSDPGFHGYLAQVDASGTQRQTLISEAVQAFDVAKVARIFTGYIRERQAKAPAPAGQGYKPPNLQEQAVPSVAGTASAPVSDKRMWKASEIRAFYKGVANRTIKDRDYITSAEQDIAAAQREGRVIAG